MSRNHAPQGMEGAPGVLLSGFLLRAWWKFPGVGLTSVESEVRRSDLKIPNSAAS